MEIAIGGEGVPQAVVRIDGDPESAWIEYSIGPNLPPVRCWRRVALERKQDSWLGEMPILDPTQELQAIAQAKYAGGFRLSSVPASVIPAKLAAARATLKSSSLICDFTDGIGGWGPGISSTQLYGAHSDIALDPNGYNGRPCLKIVPLLQPFTHFSVTLWRVGDPQWRTENTAALSVWVKGIEKGIGFTSSVLPRQVGEKTYSVTVPLKPEKGWQQVIVKREQFKEALPVGAKPKKDDVRKELPSWKDVQCILIAGPVAAGDTPRIGPVEWLPGPP
jgi:hypothetical protein